MFYVVLFHLRFFPLSIQFSSLPQSYRRESVIRICPLHIEESSLKALLLKKLLGDFALKKKKTWYLLWSKEAAVTPVFLNCRLIMVNFVTWVVCFFFFYTMFSVLVKNSEYFSRREQVNKTHCCDRVHRTHSVQSRSCPLPSSTSWSPVCLKHRTDSYFANK